MSDATAQKVGRGGAGNFYTATDNKTTPHNISAPEKSSASFPSADTHPPTYFRIGRGGIGNFITPGEELPASSSDVVNDLPSTREAVDASGETLKNKTTKDQNNAYRGLSGRGGIGNWKPENNEAEKKTMEDEEMKLRSRLAERVRLDVEMELKPPPKVHAAPRVA